MAAGAVVTLAALVLAGCTAAPRAQPPQVILYGDSLSVEAFPYFSSKLSRNGIAGAVDRSTTNVGICDLFDEMEADKDSVLPTAVVIQFTGNPNPACVQAGTGDTVERYRADAQRAIDLWKPRGVHVFLVAPPPRTFGPGTPEAPDPFRDMYLLTALANGVGFLDAGHSVFNPVTGLYQFHMPCDVDEGPEAGCVDGLIQVRDPSDGIHFCPAGTRPFPCMGHVSGARRFGEAMADPVVAQLGF
jgi:hypothetical protein